MIRAAATLSFLAVMSLADVSQAGEMILRETEAGIYVELTGEKAPEVKAAQPVVAPKLTDEQKYESLRLQRQEKRLAKQKAKRLKRQQEPEEGEEE